ncbi:MAG: hypothetical protein ACI9R3_003396 [Verrucomicrobiales bacterium]|jgi:hypothetical protein
MSINATSDPAEDARILANVEALRKSRFRQWVLAVCFLLLLWVAGGFFTFLVANNQGTNIWPLMAGLALAILGFAIIARRLASCPQCHQYIGKISKPKFCPQCGEQLQVGAKKFTVTSQAEQDMIYARHASNKWKHRLALAFHFSNLASVALSFSVDHFSLSILLLINLPFLFMAMVALHTWWHCPACDKFLGELFHPRHCPGCAVQLK